jgi:hypothetical protein
MPCHCAGGAVWETGKRRPSLKNPHVWYVIRSWRLCMQPLCIMYILYTVLLLRYPQNATRVVFSGRLFTWSTRVYER